MKFERSDSAGLRAGCGMSSYEPLVCIGAKLWLGCSAKRGSTSSKYAFELEASGGGGLLLFGRAAGPVPVRPGTLSGDGIRGELLPLLFQCARGGTYSLFGR